MKNLIISIFKTFLFFDLSLIVINLLPEVSGKNAGVSALLNAIIGFSVVLVLTVVFLLFVEKRKISLPFEKPVSGVFKGIFFGAFPPVIALAFAAFFNKFKFTPENDIKKIGLWWLILLINCIMTELLLRGYLFALYKKHFGLTISVIATTLLSCSLDFSIFSGSKIYIANIILFNILLCFILNSSKSILASVIAKFTFLAINTVLLGCKYPLGGYPAVYKITFSGNILLNGGKYGIMGSVLMLVLLLVICLIFIYKAYNVSENLKKFSKFMKRFSNKA